MHFTYIYVIKKTLENTRFKTLLFYTYYETHLLFVYLHLYIFSLVVHFNKNYYWQCLFSRNPDFNTFN